jgi:hypothetical protein
VSRQTSGQPPIERIEAGGMLLAVILRASYEPDSIEFLTDDAASMQLGVMRRPAGHVIQPHVHRPAPRSIDFTCETLFIVRGRVEVTFFTDDHTAVGKRELAGGDTLLLVRGGHGFRVIEDCKMIEVKQGPYAGQQFDKFRFGA